MDVVSEDFSRDGRRFWPELSRHLKGDKQCPACRDRPASTLGLAVAVYEKRGCSPAAIASFAAANPGITLAKARNLLECVWEMANGYVYAADDATARTRARYYRYVLDCELSAKLRRYVNGVIDLYRTVAPDISRHAAIPQGQKTMKHRRRQSEDVCPVRHTVKPCFCD